jgi:hypothetical protein
MLCELRGGSFISFGSFPDTLYDTQCWRCAAEMFDFIDVEHGFLSKRQRLAGLMEISERFEKTEPKDSI